MKVDWIDTLASSTESHDARVTARRSQVRPGYVVTIGSFDGVHRGHQHLISQVVQRARTFRSRSLVVTFEPLPAEVLHPQNPPERLSDIGERLSRLDDLGVDQAVVVPFTVELSLLTPAEFLSALTQLYPIQELWAGEDFTFGHRREGTADYLRGAAPAFGFAVHIIPRLNSDGVRLGSSQIRSLIRQGLVGDASKLLGHSPSVTGIVVHGAARGRALGYPTANLKTSKNIVIPKTGIYAGFACLEERHMPAAISVGYNPTFGANPLSVEAFILDFDEDIFGRNLKLEFVERLRDEQFFESVDALVAQMSDDVARTREILAISGQEPGPALESAPANPRPSNAEHQRSNVH